MKFMTRLKRYFLALALAGAAYAQAPAPLPQPATAQYGVEQLNLYPTYDRAEYQAKFGVQAPAFDSKKQIKTWFDAGVSCVANLSTSFKALNDNPNSPALVSFSVPSCDVSKVNLPGKYVLTPYKFNTVQNIQIIANGFAPTVIGAGLQSTRADAEALKAEIGDTSLAIIEKIGPTIAAFPQFGGYQKIDADSPVSFYMLGKMNVEQALIERYGQGQGVGSPGVWTKVGEGAYQWTRSQLGPDGTDGSYKVLSTPVRDLQSNERLGNCSTNVMFPSPCVQRTDLSTGSPAPTGNGAASVTEAEVLRLVKAIAALLGVQ